MADQEQEHIDKFNELILEHRVRPTALLPLWNVAGFALGASTALMGEKAAMACTVAVEKVIGEHYQEQLDLLGDDHKDLKKTISKFRDDELEHHDIGIEHDAENAPGYKIMSKIIEFGCKTAIAISKKFNFLVLYPNIDNLSTSHEESLVESFFHYFVVALMMVLEVF